MSVSNNEIDSVQLQQDKLKLLSFSKNLLLLAEQENYTELKIQQGQWREFLERMIERYGQQLQVIAPMLQEDAKQLECLLNSKQSRVVDEFSSNLKANQAVRKFVQF